MASILIVDDELVVCKSCKKILERSNHSIDYVLTGQEALENIKEKEYEIVITDLKMPGIDGMKLLNIIKETCKEVDVIMVTGYASIDTAVKAMKLGAFDYIPKPFTPDELRGVVARALERRRLLEQEREKASRTHVRFEYTMPDELYYLPEHAWVKLEKDGNVTAGVDDVFQKSVGEIVKIKLPDVGDEVEQGKLCSEIEDSSRRAHNLWSPISGKVIETNERLTKNPTIVNRDPYGEGWIIRVEPSNLDQDLKNLIYGEALVKWWLKREIIEKKDDKYLQLSALDPRFKYEIAKQPGGENIKVCFGCGICTASCPVREIDETYNPRKIIRMALLGMRDVVLKSDFIWLCSTCYTCAERCPQGVRFTDVINAIKNIAVQEGYIHPALRMQAELLEKDDRLYEIGDFDNKKREKLGLPRVHSEKNVISEIFKVSGFKEIMEKEI
ncbi:glycine cleavage system protein GcvH [candidate division WOR-3 bacterium]|nr:glycine cleavage system protein GcvH [candidate division WOR-3 bacterium]